MTNKAKTIEQVLKNGYTEENGVYYFIDTPEDINPSPPNKDVTNPRKWTPWRRANFKYYESLLADCDKEKDLVLDFGAGQSHFANLMKDFNTVNADFYPYEPIDVVCDLTKPLPFQNNSFDVIIAANVFEHLPDTANVLRECFRILKTNGKIIGTIPFLFVSHQRPYDFVRYTDIMLKKLLDDAGFSEIKITPLGKPATTYLNIQKRFFYEMYPSTQNNKIGRIAVKIAWALQRIFNFAFVPVYNLCKSDKLATGYGFYARKI